MEATIRTEAPIRMSGMKLKNRYILMRHGESVANREGIIVSDPSAGTVLFGLTERGRRQAADAIKNCGLGESITAIRSSDFLRAAETAGAVSDILNVPVETSVLLRERFFGCHEGMPADRYGDVWEQDAVDPDNAAGGVEPPSSVAGRMLREIESCEDRFRGGVVLLVSHGDPLQMLIATIIGIGPHRHRNIPHFSQAELRELVTGDAVEILS